MVNKFLRNNKSFERIKGWFHDFAFRSLIKNSVYIFSGNILSSIFLLISTGIKTRVLGIEKFGSLALVISFVALIEQLTALRPWQALIKFGAEYIKENKYSEIAGIIKFSFAIDLVCGVIGLFISLLLTNFVGKWLGWSSDILFFINLFSISLLFNFSGTSIGILRLFNRFELQALKEVLSGVLTLLGSIVVLWSGAGIYGFIIAALLMSIVINIAFLIMALSVLQQNKLGYWWRQPISDWKPFLRFSSWAYLSSILDIPVQKLDIIIVSTVISLEATGIYKIIKQVMNVLAMMANPIYQSIYPQFTSMIANNEKKRSINYAARISSLLLFVVGVPIVLLTSTSSLWMGILFGREFSEGSSELNIFLFISFFSLSLISIHPLFTALGYVKQTTIITLISNFFYLVFAWFLGQKFGLFGVAIAYFAQICIVLLMKIFLISKSEILIKKQV